MKIRLVMEFGPEDAALEFHDLARILESMAKGLRQEADRLAAREKKRNERMIEEAKWIR